MRKISLVIGATVLAFGVTAASSAAFASCLTNQESLPTISLSQTAMTPNDGTEYDKGAYDAAVGKGNACPTTEQSQPVSDVQTRHGKRLPTQSYN